MTDGFQITDGVLTVSPGTRYIRSQQFISRNDFRKLVIPDGVGFFEEEAFAECAGLEEAVLPDTLVNIGVAAFTGCSSLRSVNIPRSVTEIEEGAFLFCGGLRSIAFPEGLKRIADLAFQQCGLESVSIPVSVEYIGEEAFFECPDLTEADVLNPSAVICTNAFGSDYRLVRGYIAPGFPDSPDAPSMLLYSLLWASCPGRHTPATEERAESFIRGNQALVMERILKYGNVPAMTGIAARGLLDPDSTDGYLRTALNAGLTEITALLLSMKRFPSPDEGEFDL